MFVEFVTSPAGPLLNTGFHFNVGNWPGHVDTAGTRNGVCDWMLSSDALKDSNASEGIFLSIAHWYPPNTTCSYHIQGNEGEVVRLYFPRFVATQKIKSTLITFLYNNGISTRRRKNNKIEVALYVITQQEKNIFFLHREVCR